MPSAVLHVERAAAYLRAKQAMTPAGTKNTSTCKSCMYEFQLGGWCSDTEAMIGMKRDA